MCACLCVCVCACLCVCVCVPACMRACVSGEAVGLHNEFTLSRSLSCDFAHTVNATSKWLTQLPTLMQNHSGGDSVASRC